MYVIIKSIDLVKPQILYNRNRSASVVENTWHLVRLQLAPKSSDLAASGFTPQGACSWEWRLLSRPPPNLSAIQLISTIEGLRFQNNTENGEVEV